MQSDSKPLNLIWRRLTLDFVLEGYFIKEVLLAGLRRPVRQLTLEEGQQAPLDNDMLVVTLGDELVRYIDSLTDRGCKNIGVFHMGDEHGDQDRRFYPRVDYVLRNYWFPQIFSGDSRSGSILWVPNGFRNGVGPVASGKTLPFAARTIPGFFSGALQDRTLLLERKEMVDVVNHAKLPFVIIGTNGFGQGLGASAYAGFMGNARFALVPAGNSPETIRLYDALEHGAIPVMLEAAFVSADSALGILGVPPVVLLDKWSSLPTVYADLAAMSLSKMEERRLEVVDWWTRLKKEQQNRVSDVIETSFNRYNAV